MPADAAQDEFNALIASSTATRASTHPEDAHDHDHDGHDEDITLHNASSKHKPSLWSTSRPHPTDADAEDYDDDADYNDYAATAARPDYIPRGGEGAGRGGNTGPKGVIADARAFEREKRNGPMGEGNAADAVARAPTAAAKSREGWGALEKEEEADDDDDAEDDDEDDEAAIRRWKTARLAELKAQRLSASAKARGGREFGGLERVDGLGYLDVVEGQHAGQKTVVVFIFADAARRSRYEDEDEEDSEDEDDSNSSQRYAQALAALATKYSNVRFIALHASEAEMEPAGVPALLAYRDGDMFARIVPLRGEVRPTSNIVSSLEECLHSHDIL